MGNEKVLPKSQLLFFTSRRAPFLAQRARNERHKSDNNFEWHACLKFLTMFVDSDRDFWSLYVSFVGYKKIFNVFAVNLKMKKIAFFWKTLDSRYALQLSQEWTNRIKLFLWTLEKVSSVPPTERFGLKRLFKNSARTIPVATSATSGARRARRARCKFRSLQLVFLVIYLMVISEAQSVARIQMIPACQSVRTP